MDIDDIKNRLKNIIRVPLIGNEYDSQNLRDLPINVDIVCTNNIEVIECDIYKEDSVGLNKTRFTVRENDSIVNDHIAKINEYLSDNELQIIEFYKNNENESYFFGNINNEKDNIFHDLSNSESNFDKNVDNYGERLEIIKNSLKEINIRIKNNNEELNKELCKLVDPYVKVLYEFYKLKIDVNNLTLFLKDFCENSIIQKIQILNKILNNVIKKEKIQNTVSCIMNISNLRNNQCRIQKLLNNKEYIEAMDIIETTLNIINNNNNENDNEIVVNYNNIKSLSTLSVRLCEISNIIEKISLEDFTNTVLMLLKNNVNVKHEDIEANLSRIGNLFAVFVDNTSKNTTHEVLLNEFHNVMYFYARNFNENYENSGYEEIRSKYTHYSVINPIVVLLRKQRINFAVDDLEFQISDQIDKNSSRVFNVVNGQVYNKDENIISISNKKIELLFFYYVINVIYKLIYMFAIVITLNNNLFNGDKLYMENKLKSHKNVYLPIIQLLEQTTTKIFSLIISVIGQIIHKSAELDIVLKFSHIYYWTCIKYILLIIEIENSFNKNVIKYSNCEISTGGNNKTNIVERGCIELRLFLYCYYKELFDNVIFNNIWLILSRTVENEKWEKSNLNEEYKTTFQLFINGELYSKDCIGVSDHFIFYNNTEYNLSLSCLQSIKYTNVLLGYIKNNSIIFYYGIVRVLQFVLNYNIKCYNIVIIGEKNNHTNTNIFKITIYSIVLCIQNIYFWLNCLEKIIKYQLHILDTKSFIPDKSLKSKVNLLNSTSNLGIMLGINMPSDHSKNINIELNKVLLKLRVLVENSIKKISDIIVSKFRLHITKWLEKNIQVQKHAVKGTEFEGILESHTVDDNINLFIKDFTNITKTLNRYLKVDANINLNIFNNVNRECTSIMKNYLLSLNEKSLDFENILLDVYCSLDKLNNIELTSSIVNELYVFFNKNVPQTNTEYSNKVSKMFQLLRKRTN
ncbi:hypothetical protein FG386_002105 [Cryptosporidium ryanae]|uniref:uncharacterized protein n=1 Tax=Cryptosporidium ryanae TaxID=515981 RepID=UPI00351A65A4|nr:hypothetical protein FG386_002105 [Cryptosporidium ryanae]